MSPSSFFYTFLFWLLSYSPSSFTVAFLHPLGSPTSSPLPSSLAADLRLVSMPSVGAVPTAVPDGMYNVLMSNSNTSKNPAPPPLQSAPGLGNNSSASSNLANGPGSSSATASGAGNGGEEISTIFVVGFPDDMQEREFQNMFIFSPGFEAATLKIPSKDQDDENTAQTSNNNSSRKQIVREDKEE